MIPGLWKPVLCWVSTLFISTICCFVSSIPCLQAQCQDIHLWLQLFCLSLLTIQGLSLRLTLSILLLFSVCWLCKFYVRWVPYRGLSGTYVQAPDSFALKDTFMGQFCCLPWLQNCRKCGDWSASLQIYTGGCPVLIQRLVCSGTPRLTFHFQLNHSCR